MTTTRALLTGGDLAYLPGIEALLRGARRHHPEVRRYCMAPAAEVPEMAGRLGDLAEVLAPPRKVACIPDEFKGLDYRLLVPEFPEDVVAWVDGDVVFRRPAPELWDVPPGRVNAVADNALTVLNWVPPDLKDRFRRRWPEVADRRGFNAGIFALRPADWPDLAGRFEAAFAEAGVARFPWLFDQPLLSVLMLDRVNWLPFAFNANFFYDHRIPADTRLLHFLYSPKPWMPGFPRHEPAYYEWVRHGLGEGRWGRLLAVKLRIWLRTPRRLLARRIRGWMPPRAA
ncbi:MAG: hypothetical protein C0501_27170 [Isosphaera sp.]|nr:hypothetical protein [Isosphaera sp.]